MLLASLSESIGNAVAEHAGEIIVGTVLALGGVFTKTKLWKKIKASLRAASKKPNFHAQHSTAQKVLTELTRMQARHSASRALVFLFHNGESFFNGKSLAKMSCYSEALDNGVTSIAEGCRGVMLSTVPEAVGFIYTAHPNGVEGTKDTNWHCLTKKCLNGGALAAAFEASGVETAMHRILYDNRDRKNPEPIGFVALQFANPDKVKCDTTCVDTPCLHFPAAAESCVVVRPRITGVDMCDEWEASSMGSCNLIEKLINDASLQVTPWRRFLGTLLGD